MKVTSVQVNNYRSIASMEFHPRPLTVLVGPNNSGKSNVADALEFMGDCYRVNPTWAMEQRGGWDRVVYRTKSPVRNRTIRFRTTIRLNQQEIHSVQSDPDQDSIRPTEAEPSAVTDNQEILIFHYFVLKPGRAGAQTLSKTHSRSSLPPGCFISHEEITIEKRQEGKLVSSLRFTLEKGLRITKKGDDSVLQHAWGILSKERIDEDPEFLDLIFGAHSNRESLALPSLMSWFYFGSEVMRQLETVRAYQPETSACRKSSSPKSYVILERNGEELPALVATLKDRLPDRFERLVNRMQSLVPNLRTLNIRETDDLQWVIDFVEQKPPRIWRSVEMSDGTMRSLALYSAIFQPRGAITVVEEPENTLHPWVIREFVQTCREIHMDRSIVLTSHSPALIDLLEPDEVVVVWKENGHTKLSPLLNLLPSAQTSWAEGRSTLYEILDSGIVPQSVPGGQA